MIAIFQLERKCQTKGCTINAAMVFVKYSLVHRLFTLLMMGREEIGSCVSNMLSWVQIRKRTSSSQSSCRGESASGERLHL